MIRNRKAFTLLELILAMALSSVVVLALYHSMSIALKARNVALANVEPARNIGITADLIGQDLQSVPPPTQPPASGNIVLAGPFFGTASALQFYSIGNDGGTDTGPLSEGLRKIELTVRTDQNPPVLVRLVTRNLTAPVETLPEEQVLCRNVKAFTVQYFDGTTWQEDWDSTAMENTLPRAVQLSLEFTADATEPGKQPQVYRITRLIPLACGG